MLNSYKSVNSKITDQFFNVIYKIQNFVYYKNDEIVCGSNNTKNDQNIRQQLLKNKTKINYLYIRNNTNKSNEHRSNVVTENVDNNICSCLNNNVVESINTLHLKINVKISKPFYSKENFNNIQFVILIFLLALLMSTVHHTAGNKTEQKTATRRRPYFLAGVSSMPDKNFTISIPCYHYTLNTIHISPNSTTESKSRICHNLRYIYQRHRNGPRFFQHIKNPINYKFNRLKIPPKWLNNYISFNVKFDTGNKNHIQKNVDNGDEYQHQYLQYRNVSNVVNKQIQKIDFNTNAINYENYLFKVVDDSNQTNIKKKTLQQTNKDRNINTNIIKINQSYNNDVNNTLTQSIKTKSKTNKDKLYTIKDNVNYNDNLQTNVTYTKILNLLQNINTASKFSSKETIKYNESIEYVDYGNNLQQKQHVDTNIIMKLVMDGLGIKKAPNMQTVSIIFLIKFCCYFFFNFSHTPSFAIVTYIYFIKIDIESLLR